MNKAPLVSIVTPTFNQKAYIEQTIRSVLNQTYINWEWIILDDGSTDGTGEIITGHKDSRIQYFFQENAGLSNLTGTYNKALQKCNGELVAMLDGDDYWPDYKLERQSKVFEDPDVVLSYGLCCLVNHKGKKIDRTAVPTDDSIACNNPVGTALKELFLVKSSFIPNPTVMVRRTALTNIGGFVHVGGLYHDFPTWTRLALEGKFSPLAHCMGYWRRHRRAVTLNSDQERFFHNRVGYIEAFIARNSERLNALGIVFNMVEMEKHWEIIGNSRIPLLHYDRAILMLKLGAFNDAEAFFRKFLTDNPSLKHTLIHFLFIISKIIHYDIVNPVAATKEKMGKFF
jgi:glycosyltransferase involved in cell wall biosynthesis